MSYLIDTDICSAHLKGNGTIQSRFLQSSGRLFVSVISVGELFTWVSRAKASLRRRQDLTNLLNDLQTLDVTTDVARKFGEVRAGLLDQGRATGEMDLLIAATALVHQFTVVTHNVQDFAHVPGLTVVDWLAP